MGYGHGNTLSRLRSALPLPRLRPIITLALAEQAYPNQTRTRCRDEGKTRNEEEVLKVQASTGEAKKIDETKKSAKKLEFEYDYRKKACEQLRDRILKKQVQPGWSVPKGQGERRWEKSHFQPHFTSRGGSFQPRLGAPRKPATDSEVKLPPLTKTPSEILATENVKFVKPAPLGTGPRKNLENYCKFHKENGHATDDCFSLRRQIELTIKTGRDCACWVHSVNYAIKFPTPNGVVTQKSHKECSIVEAIANAKDGARVDPGDLRKDTRSFEHFSCCAETSFKVRSSCPSEVRQGNLLGQCLLGITRHGRLMRHCSLRKTKQDYAYAYCKTLSLEMEYCLIRLGQARSHGAVLLQVPTLYMGRSRPDPMELHYEVRKIELEVPMPNTHK
ncbi:hypothetical protein E3N88_07336 [Mikania micrantha]|uniref:Uncharacterized protein n=1 Tax=Mikania micrantha TaxID=192012 RepID=A0A5N6PTN2_9ASTR|nr:hypothetical protein E3N88_07336 [Mikania micrantha]